MNKILVPGKFKRKIRVLLGTPTYEGIKTKCVAAREDFMVKKMVGSRFTIHSMLNGGTYLDSNREEISQAAIDDNYDYLFFVDSDMIFRPDVLDRLYDRHKDVVGAIYSLRSGKNHGPAIYNYRKDKGDFTRYPYWPINKFLKVDGIGTGLLLIKIEALKKIPAPRFAYLECVTPDKKGNRRRVGEDLSFCIRCKENGIKVYADGTIWVGHLGEKIWSYKDFQVAEIIAKEGFKGMDCLTVG